MRLLCGIALATCAAASPGAAQCAEWSDGFHASGVDSSVLALEVWDDGGGPALYVGGNFRFARDVEAKGIARWDGAQWSDLGGGLANTGSTAQVRHFQIHDDGSGPALYVAGHFDQAGGALASNVARWDGTAWTALGGGLTGASANVSASALTVFDDGSGSGPELYAGGTFGLAGGAPALGVARWDGSAWHPVGNWSDPQVLSLAVYDDGSGPALYAGGYFEIQYGAVFDGVARWNGTSWSDVGGGLNDDVYDMAVFDGGSAGPRLFLCGRFVTYNGSGINKLAIWDGSWTYPGCSFGSPPFELEVLVEPGQTAPRLFIGGSFQQAGLNNVARWKQTGCLPLGPGTNDDIYALEVFDDGSGPKLYAGGIFHTAGTERADGIAVWDGNAWSPVSTGAGAALEVDALGVADVGGAGAELYGGTGVVPGGYTRTIERFDGTSWTRIADTDGQVRAVGRYDDGQGERLVVGGSFKDVGGTAVGKVAAWDGTSWDPLAGGMGGGEVECLLPFDFGTGPELVAGGQFQLPGARIARWNGTAWSEIGKGFDKRVKALSAHDEGAGPRLFAGGHITKKLPLSGTNIIMKRLSRWDGSDWTAVHANDVDDPVRALASFDALDGSGPLLVFGGEFDYPGVGIAAWDGSAWLQLSSGVTLPAFGAAGTVNALAVYDDGSGPAMYVGGRFEQAGPVPAQNIARWDGAVWSALGAGLDGEVLSLAVHDDGDGLGPRLYVGGKFRTASGKSSFHVARWGPSAPCPPATYCTSGVSSSGCSASLAAVGVASASGATAFDLSVSAAEGNRAGLIFYGLSGAKATPWGLGSLQCVRAPHQRTGVQTSGGTTGQCDGSFALDWNAFLAARPGALGNPFVAGQSVWAQAWLLDPPAPKGAHFSAALRFLVYP